MKPVTVDFILRERIADLKKRRRDYTANPKNWNKLGAVEDQLKFNKQLYYYVVKFPRQVRR